MQFLSSPVGARAFLPACRAGKPDLQRARHAWVPLLLRLRPHLLEALVVELTEIGAQAHQLAQRGHVQLLAALAQDRRVSGKARLGREVLSDEGCR